MRRPLTPGGVGNPYVCSPRSGTEGVIVRIARVVLAFALAAAPGVAFADVQEFTGCTF